MENFYMEAALIGTKQTYKKEVLMELLIEYFRYTNTMQDEEEISYDKILNVLCNKYSSKIKVI